MANIKELIQSIESPDSSFDEKLAVINEMQDTLVAMKEHEQEAIDDNVELIIEALRTIEAKVEAKLRIVPEKGEQGIQGQKGEQGDRGLDGAQGKDGKSGVDGKDGIDGKDGVSVQDAKIDFDGSLVITLSDGREINVGEVVPVDVAQTIHKIQSGSGGDSQTTLNAIAALQATIATYGTMATQNANAVAITGGTINNTTVGATTPAAGTFTTLTAQNETLKGTGQNLIFQSQTYTHSSWFQSTVTRLDNQTTAPDGSSTAGTITSTNTVYGGLLRQTPVLTATTYTISAYVKKNNWSYVGLRIGSLNGAADRYAYFNFDTLATSTNGISGATFTATSVGSGWYRIALSGLVTASAGGATDVAVVASDGSSATNNGAGQIVYVWGVQLELGSTANTYIPTTTTAVYGTPTLSFSGVASIGLQSDGSLYHQPAGTGAVQAQATTSSAVGGNARGANAVDWQTSRNAANQVSSGTGTTLSGGSQNVASNAYTSVGGGVSNGASGFAGVVSGGWNNYATGNQSVVSGGYTNTSSGLYGNILGGQSNTAAGIYNIIGGGFTNTGTANAAVTTQSATMNATTAVTLSGSNASIKVGQYITGTSISADTYVAAISGTSLTLSKVASGSSTSTLSFYTPHGVVVGGGNNQATGSYSFIGGGGDAGTAANRNVASGDWSVVVGGYGNTASGLGSFIGSGLTNSVTGLRAAVAGGFGNQATAQDASILGGTLNTASGVRSSVLGGSVNVANAEYSSVLNGQYVTTRSIAGAVAFGAGFAPIASVAGTSQCRIFTLGRQTTDATATVLATDGNSVSSTNQVILPNNSAYAFKGTVIANVTGAANGAAWSIEGAIMRGANAASTVLIDTPSVNRVAASSGASAWVVAVTADTTNGGLAVTVTGAASTTIRWVAKLETAEVTF